MMSNPWCNNGGKSSSIPCNNQLLENREDLLLGWFKKLNVDEKEELIREICTKVQAISIQKLPGESEEDFKSRHFQQLLKKLSSNSKKSVGSKILKAYLKLHCSSSPQKILYKPQQFNKVKSIDSRQTVPLSCLQRQQVSDEDSSLNPELFKIKLIKITGGKPQGEQGSTDQH